MRGRIQDEYPDATHITMKSKSRSPRSKSPTQKALKLNAQPTASVQQASLKNETLGNSFSLGGPSTIPYNPSSVSRLLNDAKLTSEEQSMMEASL